MTKARSSKSSGVKQPDAVATTDAAADAKSAVTDAFLDEAADTVMTKMSSTEASSKGTKRERAPPPEPAGPSEHAVSEPSMKKTKTRKASSEKASSEEVGAKATKAEERKAKAEKTKADKDRKANERTWKQKWKQWIESVDNKSNDVFQWVDEDVINVKESQAVYSIKRDELNCIPHCNALNPHGAAFAPMKLFRQTDVHQLAFRKEALLAGISSDDDVELLRQGKDLYEAKHGSIKDMYAAKLGHEGRFGGA